MENRELIDTRVLTSRLLGLDSSLVLHGGGNTSVKVYENGEDILYVKGSGWDLATIEKDGFAPVKLAPLLDMAKLQYLNDTDMVEQQKLAMTNRNAPTPSIEAILHAIIPFRFVDHSHSDSIVTITNTKNGENYIKEIYGDSVLIVPYVMPGFILAKTVFDMTRNIDWDKLEGIVLLHHGLFTFSDDAMESYNNHLNLVKKAKDFLDNLNFKLEHNIKEQPNLELIAKIRQKIFAISQKAKIGIFENGILETNISQHKDLDIIGNKGTLTPDHVIRTKRVPAIIKDELGIEDFVKEYIANFNNFNNGDLQLLEPTPNWVIIRDIGTISFGNSFKDAKIVSDIKSHTIEAILKAQLLGGFETISKKESFEIEYWELEQAKLKKAPTAKEYSGLVVLVLEREEYIWQFYNLGACIITPLNVENKDGILITENFQEGILSFGGLDILVMAHENRDFIFECLPFLKFGINPKIIIGEKVYKLEDYVQKV